MKFIQQILARTSAANGDLLFFGADKASIVNDALGALRVKLGIDRGLVEGDWQPLWVIDFPMFEWDEKEKRWNALHHPFTAPNFEDAQQLLDQPGESLSKAYDMVLNGTEVGWWLGAYSPARYAACRVRGAKHICRRSRKQIWIFIKCVALWLPATWWYCIWSGSISDVDDRQCVDTRCHGFP